MPDKNEQQKETKHVKWYIFAWAIAILFSLFLGAVSMSATSLTTSNDNKTEIGILKEREDNHYIEIKDSLGRIEDNINEILKKNIN